MTIVEIVLSLFSLIMTGIAKILWDKFSKVERAAEKANADLAEFKLHVAITHPTQDHLGKAIDGFNASVREMFGKLDGIREEIADMATNFRDRLDKKQDRA